MNLLYLSWLTRFSLLALHTSHFCLTSNQAEAWEGCMGFLAWAAGAWLYLKD